MTNCDDCRLLLVDYERGELDDVRDAAMHGHLQACSACREQWQDDLALVDSLRAWSAERDFPASVLAGVRQAMHADPEPSFADRLRVLWRPAFAAPMAAALLVVGYFGYQHARTPAPAPITGLDLVREHFAQTASLPSSDRAWSTYILTSANPTDQANGSNAQPGN